MLFDKSTMQGVQSEDNPEDWFCADLNIGLSSKDWLKLLKDSSVFNSTSLTIMKRMLDYGGKASCKQLAAKYGKGVGFYNRGSSSLAKRVCEKTNCNVFRDDTGYTHWYTILYLGKHGGKNGYIWKLRPELEAALNQFDLSKFNLYEDEYKNQMELFNFTTGEGEKELKAINFWWLNANPKLWSFSELEVGDIQDYTLYSETGHKRRIFQNFLLLS